jgi:hypothetical protein
VQTIQQSQATVKSMYQAILQANPRLKSDPQTAFQAVDDMISQMKGVDQSDKNLALQQNKLIQLQWQIAKDAADNASKQAIAGGHDATRVKTNEASIEGRHEDVAAQQAGATNRTGMRDSTQVQTTGMRDSTQERDTDARDSTSVQVAGMRGGAGAVPRPLKARIGADARDIAAQKKTLEDRLARYTRGDLKNDPQRKAKIAAIEKGLASIDDSAAAVADSGSRAGRPGGQPAGAYKSADDVVKAYKAGQLSHDAATQILQQNGWVSR